MKRIPRTPFLLETDAFLIRAELDRLLSDRRFSGSRQMSAFLRYIVNETLEGNGERIKAYTVGVDALGKPDGFDAQMDPSVRVLALRLRRTLAAVYEDHADCRARIVLKVGTYVPTFYKRHARIPPLLAEANGGASLKSAERGTGTVAPSQTEHDRSANDCSITEPGSVERHQCSDRASESSMKSMSLSPRANAARLPDRWVLFAGAAVLAAAWMIFKNQADTATLANLRDVSAPVYLQS